MHAVTVFLYVLLCQMVKMATFSLCQNCEGVDINEHIAPMNQLASLFLPAAFGLVAGMAHGVVSHAMDLPISLGEQVVLPLVESDPWSLLCLTVEPGRCG